MTGYSFTQATNAARVTFSSQLAASIAAFVGPVSLDMITTVFG